MSDGRSERTALAGNRPGRHRRSAAEGTWTPAVDTDGGSGRHRAPTPEALPAEQTGRQVAVISGELPMPLAAPVPPPPPVVPAQRPATPPAQRSAIPPALRAPSAAAERPVARTKVTLGAPAEPVEEARIYVAPLLDGLSSFDLGSVPASVTPPRSWRKAAWFATVSSGGVAVALLLAGSMLVGQPTRTDDALRGWAGFDNRPPVWHDEGMAAPDRDQASRSTRTSADGTPRYRDVAGVNPSGTPEDGTGSVPGGPSSVTATPTGVPSSTAEPEKPPTRPASRETRSDAVYRFPPNAQTMGDRSEIFLNEITENPERAHEQTGGDLYAEGAEGIAARYAHIAYFEVTHIYIDQKNRETINTVEIYYTDGTHERGQRTLKFEDGDKITDD